ncbi:MAG: DNA polymerase II, partial [Acidobacteria bacterium]|nr:DNA polymerase II [Acidobacteriota bacterium]
RDPVHQFLLHTGKTSFLGMQYRNLRRLQLDIETYTGEGFDFPSAARPSDRIIAVALCDSTGWEKVVSGRDLAEPDLLAAMVEAVRSRDPDVIEGHNLFRFDLEYIETRARRHRVKLALGRDGSVLRGHPSRLQIAERAITYRKYEIAGRHIIDTWILAQHFDVSDRSLPGYGLKDIARHFGVAPPDRTYVPSARISHCFDHEPDRLMAYALDDVRETRAIADLLSPAYFTQAQIFPFGYQNVVLRGSATKIDSLFLREYLHRGKSIPGPWMGREIAGGHVEIQNPGIRSNVLHCDVTSLYPSIMMAFKYYPQKDWVGVLPALLKDLTEFRVQAKRLARDCPPGDERVTLEALQSTFKVLINSFYGYLGFAQGHFNDFEAANLVTAKGRELIRQIMEELESRGAQVLEVDTDGIYFVPPAGVDTPAAEEKLMEAISAGLPTGIRLELAGRYRGMFNYKMKNYVLLDHEGRLIVKGSGLRSRGLEPFQRNWMHEMFRLLLEGRREEGPALLERYRRDFAEHRVPLETFMKTETLQESPDGYREKVRGRQRNPAAPYELALRAGRPYQAGDQVSYYVTGDSARVKVHENCRLASEYDPAHPDENVPYYQAKLQDLYERFRPWIEGGQT